MFPYEYKSTMVIQTLRDYAPFVMVTGVILGGMIAILYAFGPAPPSIASVIPEAVPAQNVKTNTTNVVPSFFNLSGNNTNTKTNTNRANAANAANAIKRNNTTNKGNNIASTSFKIV